MMLITPKRGWLRLDVREVWNYRELLYFLTWRDIKVRYKQTAIGITWAVLQPVLTTIIFTALFSRFAGFETPVPYPLFVLSALALWLFVHTSVTTASTSFVNYSNLVTKVYFPRIIVPVAGALASLFDLLFSLGILIVFMLYFRVPPTVNLPIALLFIGLAFILATAVGTLFAALNIRFRDVKFALPFLLQVWMIASPIFYPSSVVPDKWKTLFALNPMTGIIEGFRSSLFGTGFDWQTIGTSIVSLLVISSVSLYVFGLMEDDFADVI